MSSSTSGKAYRIEEDPLCGRQLVASRKIYAGELIIDEPALITGPGFTKGSYFFTRNVEPSTDTGKLPQSIDFTQDGFLVCLVCCVNLNVTNRSNCPSCNLLLCNNEKCHAHSQHRQNECLVFPKIRQLWKSKSRSRKSFYRLILVIRGLFYKLNCPSKWDQIRMLQSQSEALEKAGAGGFSDIQDVFRDLLWDTFAFSCLTQEGALSEINGNFNKENEDNGESVLDAARHCLDVMTINAFSSFTDSYSREGLFFLSSFMSHSCIINTDRQIEASSSNSRDISESRMVVRASVDIEKDDPITTTYLSLLYNTEERNRMLITSWLFLCKCRRCQDSRTECGTFLSGVMCQEKLSRYCDLETEEKLSSLVCENSCDLACKFNMEINYLRKVAESRPKNLFDTDKLEDWLDQYDTGNIFHPNHSIFAHLKLFLIQYYGRTNEGMDSLTVDQLKRKLLYCHQILGIYNKVSPGIQMCRGIILFELWRTLQKLSDLQVPLQITYPLNLASDATPLMSMSFQETDKEVIKMEALNILKYALSGTSEEAMAIYLQEDDSSIPITN
ncbi:unnamed protein product [Orchesella dallaii]|uniref:SET domain-containing protein n=1 Tax=Orchesella dallaii TaxID=48710 RepID=A0ABP1R7W5_9HEXA